MICIRLRGENNEYAVIIEKHMSTKFIKMENEIKSVEVFGERVLDPSWMGIAELKLRIWLFSTLSMIFRYTEKYNFMLITFWKKFNIFIVFDETTCSIVHCWNKLFYLSKCNDQMLNSNHDPDLKYNCNLLPSIIFSNILKRKSIFIGNIFKKKSD